MNYDNYMYISLFCYLFVIMTHIGIHNCNELNEEFILEFINDDFFEETLAYRIFGSKVYFIKLIKSYEVRFKMMDNIVFILPS